ncbi:hypothetical protein [Pseudomarimonas arenosa]|uniref:Uncharacterized protein n=1 Tax=Pseudomarimonas arenosa TaxID=2774145 RepID=A0AAW3ZF13_9GAMM|nr:hypothetical protein [Pseudomarimonas arenosa]MBD8524120.1 hypothetical protein [Pseudomarimonas arenosa]
MSTKTARIYSEADLAAFSMPITVAVEVEGEGEYAVVMRDTTEDDMQAMYSSHPRNAGHVLMECVPTAVFRRRGWVAGPDVFQMFAAPLDLTKSNGPKSQSATVRTICAGMLTKSISEMLVREKASGGGLSPTSSLLEIWNAVFADKFDFERRMWNGATPAAMAQNEFAPVLAQLVAERQAIRQREELLKSVQVKPEGKRIRDPL